MDLSCQRCKGVLHNIEYSASSYYSYVCVNINCTIHGKIQIHGQWDKPEVTEYEFDELGKLR